MSCETERLTPLRAVVHLSVHRPFDVAGAFIRERQIV
jgi:hypothetical protein